MFDDLIADASWLYNVPDNWIRAVISTESQWNPNAFNPNDPDGARGLMQIIGPTARSYGVTNLDSLYDPALNIDIGTHLLHDLIVRNGNDFSRVYSAYNSGDPDAYLVSSQVSNNVHRALSYLADWESQHPTVVASGGVLVLLLIGFLILRKG